MEVLTRCRHNGFPVVRSCLGDDEDSGEFDAAGQGASRAGSLQGLILRSQILVMLRHQVRLPRRRSPVTEPFGDCFQGRVLSTACRASFCAARSWSCCATRCARRGGAALL